MSKYLFAGIALLTFMALTNSCTTLQKTALPLTEQFYKEALFRIPAKEGQKFIVLTIDDAPSSYTDEILDILAGHEVKATFFIHTDQIDISSKRQKAMERIAFEGHDISHHMPKDVSLKGMKYDDFKKAFAHSHNKLKPYGDAMKLFFRPPHGAYSSKMINPVLEEFGYVPHFDDPPCRRRYMMASFIPWDAAKGKTDHPKNRDRNLRNGQRYSQQLANNLFSGAIVIFHDGEDGDGGIGTRKERAKTTIASLEQFIPLTQSKGYKILSLSQALEETSLSCEISKGDASINQ